MTHEEMLKNATPEYHVEVESDGCEKCGHETYWAIVYSTDTAGSTSYGNKEHAEELCEMLNVAFTRGMEQRAVPFVAMVQALNELIPVTVDALQTVEYAATHRLMTLPELREEHPDEFNVIDKATVALKLAKGDAYPSQAEIAAQGEADGNRDSRDPCQTLRTLPGKLRGDRRGSLAKV